jgi:RNA polymerase sigma-70 factor (TIGR02960 family)
MREAVNAMSFSARRSQTHMTALELTDETAFGAAVEPHRRELQLHCYRMLGNFEESEDLTQETFLRAWRGRETYAGRASVRAWLYKIATNACLDALERRPRVPTETGEMDWLQPYPDALMVDDAEEIVVERETIELVFMIAIQHLAPRPRAVLILRDVLGWRARDVASLLDTSVASVNSALQRARAVLKEHLPPDRGEWTAAGSAVERSVLDRYVAYTEAGDAAGIASLMHEDARFMMPPEVGLMTGRDTIVASWVQGGFGAPDFGDFRLTIVRANHAPALANYVRKPDEDEFHLFALDVLRIEDGAIVDVIAFSGSALDPFGLPNTLAV